MRILFATPFRNWDFGRLLQAALVRIGHDVEAFDYRNCARVFGVDSLDKVPVIQRIGRDRVNKRLLRRMCDSQPDLLLVFKGELIDPDTVAAVRRRGAGTALWFPDDPHLFSQIGSRIATAYDFVFTSSARAVAWYAEIGVKNAQWIGFACEPLLHRKLVLSESDGHAYGADVCFIGTCYPERLALARHLAKFDLKIWGSGWEEAVRGDSRLERCVRGRGLYLEDLAKAYNASKIIVNVHPCVQREGWIKANMRVYEAAGCAGLVLTDRSTGLDDVFDVEREVRCYDNAEHAVRLVEHYLAAENERMSIGENAQRRAYRDHKYEDRARQVIAAVQ